MKKNYKKLFPGILSALFLIPLSAQNIELPEVTTVITGESVTAGSDALPDFENLIIPPQDSSKESIILPEVTVSSSSLQKKTDESDYKKDIFAEGKIGGGFPALFTGEFSVFRTATNNPFKIFFSYDSAVGYSGKNLTDGFSDQTVNLYVEKKYSSNNFNWEFGGGYNDFSNGLQNQEKNISKLNQNKYFGNIDFFYELQKNVKLGANFDMDFYNRYADTINFEFPSAAVLSLTPEIYASWSGYGFETSILAEYLFENEIQNVISGDANNRGEISAIVKWENDLFTVDSSVGVIFGNKIGKQSVLVPFSLGVNACFPVYFSNRKVGIYAQGGLESFENRVSKLEQEFKFSSISVMPFETSNWYGKTGFSIPLKESFTGSADFTFKTTAFSNGRLQSVYKKTSMNNGLYGFVCQNITQFASNIEFSYHYKIFSVTGGWKSNWLDVPVLENTHQIFVNLNFQSENSKWGAELQFIQPLEFDYVDSFVNFEGFVKLTSAVRAVISLQDIVKLVKAEPRIYCGDYYGRGGTATFLLKFFF